MKRDTLQLFRTIETLFTIKDLDSLLEKVLTEARRVANADAGTIYLCAKGYLYFSFVQNDTLFKGETKDKYIPSGASIPVDKKSLAGYGITPDDVAAAGCYPFDLAAWRLRQHIRKDRGDLWTRAANYHSRTPQYNAVYRADLLVKAGRWADWLEARLSRWT
jgi:GAF domain-containing protein